MDTNKDFLHLSARIDQALASTAEHAAHVATFYRTILKEVESANPEIGVQVALDLTKTWIYALITNIFGQQRPKPPEKDQEKET